MLVNEISLYYEAGSKKYQNISMWFIISKFSGIGALHDKHNVYTFTNI